MSDITIIAKLKKVIWKSFENDFTITAFIPEKLGVEFIATGDLFNPAEGLIYSLSGKWKDHPKYGKQFVYNSYCMQEPIESDSIAVYLSKHVKGIGPVMAGKLIEKYGKSTIAILKGAPERVSGENKRISYEFALKIQEQLQAGDKRQDVLIQLEGIFSKIKGLPKQLATDVLNTYGLSAYEIIKNNPYVLTEMNRVGFLSADKVAIIACGIKADDPERIKHGILYVVGQSVQESGDVWISPVAINESLLQLIPALKLEVFTDTIKQLIAEEVLILNEKHVTFYGFDKDESVIADCVVNFLP